MIKAKSELKSYILCDNSFSKQEKKMTQYMRFVHDTEYYISKYLKYLRKQEYYLNTSNGKKIKVLFALLYERKKHILGNKLGFYIGPNCFEMGINLWHHGTVIVNPNAKIGKNCILHGNNCIGNNGIEDKSPTIGNNVDIGFGAVVIGDITIADNIKIGANAVVNKSFTEPGITIAGVPAKRVK